MDKISVTCAGCGVTATPCQKCGELPDAWRRRGYTVSGNVQMPKDSGAVFCPDCARSLGQVPVNVRCTGHLECNLCKKIAQACACGNMPADWILSFRRAFCSAACLIGASTKKSSIEDRFSDIGCVASDEMDANLEAARERVRSTAPPTQPSMRIPAPYASLLRGSMQVGGTAQVSAPDENGVRTVESFELTHVSVNMPTYRVGDHVMPTCGPFKGEECVVTSMCPIDACYCDVVPAKQNDGIFETAAYGVPQLLPVTGAAEKPRDVGAFRVRDTVAVVIPSVEHRKIAVGMAAKLGETRAVPTDIRRPGFIVEAFEGTSNQYMVEHTDGEHERIRYREDQLRHADVAYAKALLQSIEAAQLAGEPVILTPRLRAILDDNGYRLPERVLERAIDDGFVILSNEERDPTEEERARFRAVHEEALRAYRRDRERSVRLSIGLDRLLPRDILAAVLFPKPDTMLRRVAFTSEAINSVLQLLGLRNGRVSSLDVPVDIADALKRADDVLSRIELTLFPRADLGRAWQDREGPR